MVEERSSDKRPLLNNHIFCNRGPKVRSRDWTTPLIW